MQSMPSSLPEPRLGRSQRSSFPPMLPGVMVVRSRPKPVSSKPRPIEDKAVERAAAMLRSGLPTAILMAGNALYGGGLIAAGRIAAATGAKLLAPYPLTRLQRGAGLPPSGPRAVRAGTRD